MSAAPGTLTAEAIAALEARHEAPLYHKRDLAVVRGEGARVWDAAGRCYIDCIGGHGVAVVGHCHPKVVAAIREQAGRLLTCPGALGNDARAAYLARLAQVTPPGLDRFFLCNSGTEAVEAAIKFARASTGRPGVVAARRGFHGRTLGALSATWKEQYRKPFQPLVSGFTHVPFNDLAALAEAVTADTAAILLEPVQGEGGVYPATPAYLQGAAQLARARGALLILDEVQTGFGRTGHLFAAEHYGVVPDLLCLAKGIAGGLPMGAVALGPRVAGLSPGMHASTFGGNPLACAAAGAALDVLLDEGLPERAARLGAAFQDHLRELALPAVREVRGLGLMIGIELRFRAAPYLAALQQAGVLALAAGPQVIRLLPPLIITEEELAQVAAALGRVLAGKEVAADAAGA
ncbi:MAG TPA: aspartate aminotransferase family protein [Firmicutes bacterium]|nr:aspartate aminotransferase family protein [Bacillota bacterium]